MNWFTYRFTCPGPEVELRIKARDEEQALEVLKEIIHADYGDNVHEEENWIMVKI